MCFGTTSVNIIHVPTCTKMTSVRSGFNEFGYRAIFTFGVTENIWRMVIVASLVEPDGLKAF